MKTSVTIKGTKTGLVITLAAEPPLAEVAAELSERLVQGSAFFKDTRVTLNAGERSLTEDEWQQLRDLVTSHGVAVQSVAATADASRLAARSVGLAMISPMASADLQRTPARAAVVVAAEGDEAFLVRRTLRSGQIVKHPASVVVLGDLNAGAEVVAGGDIMVWGRLRGTAHAGALGDIKAAIYALQMAPTQLRIFGFKAVPPEREGAQVWPEVAYVHEGRIVVDPWGRGK
jgi:septum site-determining protein MinC